MTRPGQVRIGTSGWVYKDWRGIFYPPKLPARSWFAYYAEHFDTVEINNTFYRLPPAETFTAWKRQAPPGFLYAVKASRFLTHQKKLKDPGEALVNILGQARHLGPHLGPILYQLPPYWRRDVARLREFISFLPLDMCHVFEFRDPSWFAPEVHDLLAETGMNFCIHDMAGSNCPSWATGDAAYVRFHGPTEKKYVGRYERAHLAGWAETIRAWHAAGRDVYVYFNNDFSGHALTNANELREMVGARPRGKRRSAAHEAAIR
jgi:uncharacterized protein YecE (DUF72 family)